MDALVERIRALREELRLLEEGLGAGPRPERLAWIELDGDGRVADASPIALARLGVDLGAVRGTPIGVLADLEGDPLADGILTIATPDGRATVLSQGDATGRTLVLGATGAAMPAGEGAKPSRKLVHDMSNVLGIMRGRAELVAMQSSDENVRRSMEEIQKAADRALQILDEEIPPR
ncbi:MAG: hypothetical protein V2J24_12100 [Pseudomonadales bacterium]|jgi:hypothetical protein|nr:hypothetical protein [Pseudomonadales bacterium]